MIVKRIVQGMVWGLASLSIGTYAWLVAHRLFYPLELDCIEGVMMDHVVRLSRGEPIFVAPTLRFISLAYMPLLAVLSSFFAHFGEPAFWQARIVSVIASFGVIGGIFAIVRAETRSLTLAVAGAGVFALGFGVTGSCYDVARPDSLMLALALAGLATLRYTSGIRGAVVAAVLMVLAFYGKQHGLIFAGAGALSLLASDRRRFLPYVVTLVVLGVGSYLALGAWLGEWFRFFTWDIPRGWSEVDRMRVQLYLADGVLGKMGVFALASVIALGSPARVWRRAEGLWWFMALGGIGTGLLATLDPSAYKHTFMGTMMSLSLLGPIALHRIAVALDDPERASSRGVLGMAAVCAAATLQFVPLLYPIHSLMPHPHSREAAAALGEVLRAYSGEWLLPFHGFYEHRAGKGTSLDIIAFDDIERSHGNSLLARDPQYVTRMVDSLTTGPTRFGIVSDVPLEDAGAQWARIADAYVLADSLGWLTESLRPLAGNRFAPRYLYVPARDTSGVGALRAAAGRLTR